MKNQKKFFDWLGRTLEFYSHKDWLKITREQVIQHGGEMLLNDIYEGSLIDALRSVYPNQPWYPWTFQRNPVDNFWENLENRCEYFLWLANILEISNYESWYEVTKEELTKNGGTQWIYHYYRSLPDAIMSCFPDNEWKPWNFKHFLSTIWSDPMNRYKFMEWISTQLNIVNKEDWYRIEEHMIGNMGGYQLLRNHYNNYLCIALESIYPHLTWHPWRFVRFPKYIWEDENAREDYLLWFANEFSLKFPEDWINISKKDIHSKGGRELISLYNDCLWKMLAENFFEWKWIPFGTLDENNVKMRIFFDWIAEHMEIHRVEDWFRTKMQDILDYGGETILKRYNNSIYECMKVAYPHTEWKPWRFIQSNEGYWEDPSHRKYEFIM